MSNLLNHARMFLSKNSPTILTCIGGVGVIASTILAAKATPKALQLLEEATEKKGEKLTKFEVVKTAAPAYIPSAIVCTTTLVCIFGANALNKRQQASLISAYALLDTSFKTYKDKVQELYGKDANDRVVEEIAKDAYEESDAPSDGKQLFYDEFSGRYFESTMETVLNAEYKINQFLVNEFYAELNEFYDMLGLEHKDFGDTLGWSIEAGAQWYNYSWIDFEHQKILINDEIECCIIRMTAPTSDFLYYD